MENRIIHLDIVSLEDKNLKSLLNRYLKEEHLTAMYGQHSYSLAGLNYILSISDIKPEIAFVDVDGLADEQTITVRELKKNHPHVILVGVSNKSASDIISAGYDAYLQPLFTNSQLTDLISVSKIKVNELPSINSTDYDYDPDSNTLIKPAKSDFNFSNLDEAADDTDTNNSNSEFNSDEDEPVSNSNNNDTTSESKSDAGNKEQNKQHQTHQSKFNNRNKNKQENRYKQHESDVKLDKNDNHVKNENNHSSEIKSDEEHEQHSDNHVAEIKSEQRQNRRERYKKNRHNFKQNKVKYAETGSESNNSNDNYKQSKKQDKWKQFKQKKAAEQKEQKQASEIKSEEVKKPSKSTPQKTELDLDASIDDMLSQENSGSDFKISVPGDDTQDVASDDSASESNNSNKDENHDNHDDDIPADLKSDDKNKKPNPDDTIDAPADDGDKPMPDLGSGDDSGVQDNSDNKASGKWVNSSNVTSDDAGTSGGLNIDFSDDDDLIAGLKNSINGNDDTVPADNGSDDQDQNIKHMDQ